jgi:hypothetical protein
MVTRAEDVNYVFVGAAGDERGKPAYHEVRDHGAVVARVTAWRIDKLDCVVVDMVAATRLSPSSGSTDLIAWSNMAYDGKEIWRRVLLSCSASPGVLMRAVIAEADRWFKVAKRVEAVEALKGKPLP